MSSVHEDRSISILYHSALCKICNQMIFIEGKLPKRASEPAIDRNYTVQIDRFHASESSCPHWKLKLYVVEGILSHLLDADTKLFVKYQNELEYSLPVVWSTPTQFFGHQNSFLADSATQLKKESFLYKIGYEIALPIKEEQTQSLGIKTFDLCTNCHGIGGQRCILCKGKSCASCNFGFKFVCELCKGAGALLTQQNQ